MSGPRRFHPAEIDLESDELTAGLLETARDLEAYAATGMAAPTVGFEDRVMVAIADEPMPRPARGLGFLATVREAWAVAFGAGRPLAMRAQALALLLILAVAVGSVGSVAVVGASRLLGPAVPPTTPSPAPSPSLLPSPVTPSPVTPSPSPSSSPTATPRPSPTETDEPSGTDDHGGSGGSGSGSDSVSGDDNSGPGGGSGGDDSSGSGSGRSDGEED
jgi:uncharacterized membrane protein YgcG